MQINYLFRYRDIYINILYVSNKSTRLFGEKDRGVQRESELFIQKYEI